jgi:hypothetical protein
MKSEWEGRRRRHGGLYRYAGRGGRLPGQLHRAVSEENAGITAGAPRNPITDGAVRKHREFAGDAEEFPQAEFISAEEKPRVQGFAEQILHEEIGLYSSVLTRQNPDFDEGCRLFRHPGTKSIWILSFFIYYVFLKIPFFPKNI